MQEQLDNLKALRKDCTDSITSSRTKSKEEHYIHKLRQLDFKIKELEERRRLIQIVTQGIYTICILVCSFFLTPIAKVAFVSLCHRVDIYLSLILRYNRQIDAAFLHFPELIAGNVATFCVEMYIYT